MCSTSQRWKPKCQTRSSTWIIYSGACSIAGKRRSHGALLRERHRVNEWKKKAFPAPEWQIWCVAPLQSFNGNLSLFVVSWDFLQGQVTTRNLFQWIKYEASLPDQISPENLSWNSAEMNLSSSRLIPLSRLSFFFLHSSNTHVRCNNRLAKSGKSR